MSTPKHMSSVEAELICEINQLKKSLEECEMLVHKLKEESQRISNTFKDYTEEKGLNLSLIRGD